MTHGEVSEGWSRSSRSGRRPRNPEPVLAIEPYHEGIKSIAIPRIGAGYGGLSWKKVRAIIEKTFEDWPGMLYVYEEYAPEEEHPA